MRLALIAILALTCHAAAEVRFVIVDPGHFHASLVLEEMYPDVAKRVAVYAPLGPELGDYVNRIARFNRRAENPTAWELDIHAGPDYFASMLREKAGNVMIMSGRNPKIDRIKGAIENGMNVLIDKPWIIVPADLPKLEAALETAERRNLAAYDIMTERYEITCILARALVNDAELFGTLEGAEASSVHYIMKMVAGAPNSRPPWFFDVKQQGEGLSDVGTHVVDLVQWTAFPDQAIDYRKDIRVLEGRHWPTTITREQFRQVTGEADFPAYLNAKDGRLDYFCNNSVSYTLRGKPVKLQILWGWEARPGTGDSYEATFRGTRGRVEQRQGEAEKFRPEIYVAGPRAALEKRLAALRQAYPGLEAEEKGGRTHIMIPDRYRVGHEAHFAQVTNQFFRYLKDPKSMPAWEKPNMAAKYYVTTKGVELAGR